VFSFVFLLLREAGVVLLYFFRREMEFTSFLVGCLFTLCLIVFLVKSKVILSSPVRIRRYSKRDLKKNQFGYEYTPSTSDGPYFIIPSFSPHYYEMPSSPGPTYEAFYIGPIFGTSNLEFDKEYDEYKGFVELENTLESKYDHLLVPDKRYRGDDGYLLFSTFIKWIVEKKVVDLRFIFY